jgi:two-component system OmpR family response regulator
LIDPREPADQNLTTMPTATPTTTARILLVEDDLKLSRTLGRGLRSEGYGVDEAHTGDKALEALAKADYDAVVLDVLLPGIDGYDVCRSLRARNPWLPVLMLTALGDVQDRIRGLDTGADDYLVKPFDFGELLARVRALLRRGPTERPAAIEVGGVHADPYTRIVTWAGTAAELTPREYELLEFMLHRAGDPVGRTELLAHVWAEDYPGSPNVVDVYIGYLRRKLPDLIRTVRGVGFTLEP